jgi:hypothetical protein
MKNIIKSLGVIVLATVIVAGVAYAGSLTPPQGTTPTNNYRTLGDIRAKLTNFALNPSATHAVSTTTSPAGSMYTLGDIYELLTAENTRLIPGNIRDGVEIFGVRGNYVGGGTPSSLTWSTDNMDTMFAPLVCTDNGGSCGLCYENSAYNQTPYNTCSVGLAPTSFSHVHDGLRLHTHPTLTSRGFVKSGPNNSGNVILGAKEYCQYLNENGTTFSSLNPVNYWRLPTRTELLLRMTLAYGSGGTQGIRNDGFKVNSYWTSEARIAGNEINRKIVQVDTPNDQVTTSWTDSKSKNIGTRCVHP